MKKKLFFIGLFLTSVFLYAQNSVPEVNDADGTTTRNHKYTQSIAANAKSGSVILWDNTNINEIGSVISSYWAENDNWTIDADDFDADGAWIIQKIYSKGNSDTLASYYPSKMQVVIYANSPGGCEPGEVLYREDDLRVTFTIPNPEENNRLAEIVLPDPFTLPGEGKYWISIAGAYDATVTQNSEVAAYRWNIRRGSTIKECNFHLQQKTLLFSGIPVGEWYDYSKSSAESHSMYFLIEGDPNIPIDCQPVTNLAVNYDTNCTKAELTWTAPSDGGSTFVIYRDGDEIATVETTSFSDETFEPTLEHNWDVIVDCNGYSPPVRVNGSVCKEPDCQQKPKNLSVVYNADCEAKLAWHAPTEILWDNTWTPPPGQLNYGLRDERWMMSELSRNILADDFVVPPGETWYISEVYVYGFYNDYTPPDFIGVEIYDNDGGLPGNHIIEEPFLTTVSGSLSQTQTILLPETVVLSSGTYWLSYYGTHDALWDENRLYYAVSYAEAKGEYQFARLNDENGGYWETYYNGDYKSMYFRVQGRKVSDEISYNVYRDGVKLETVTGVLQYTDSTFNPIKSHTWSVKMVCPEGGESAPSYLTVPPTPYPCEWIGVSENQTTSFKLFPNPTTGILTITAINNFNTVEVINFLGQKVISQSNLNSVENTLDVSTLTNGVYFIRITSETGTAVQKFVKQ